MKKNATKLNTYDVHLQRDLQPNFEKKKILTKLICDDPDDHDIVLFSDDKIIETEREVKIGEILTFKSDELNLDDEPTLVVKLEEFTQNVDRIELSLLLSLQKMIESEIINLILHYKQEEGGKDSVQV